MPLCRSTDVHVDKDAHHRLIFSPCTLYAGHVGECEDEDGHRWTRVAEYRRQDRARRRPGPLQPILL